MNIYSTWNFFEELDGLCKKKHKKFYGRARKDLGEFFQENPTIDHIHKHGDSITNLNYEDTNKPYKIRIGNSTMRDGTRGGYRLVAFVVEDETAVVLISIYPKKGPLGKVQPTNDEWQTILADYIEDRSNGTLYEMEVLAGELQVVVDTNDDSEE